MNGIRGFIKKILDIILDPELLGQRKSASECVSVHV